jgi:hypothetical protein
LAIAGVLCARDASAYCRSTTSRMRGGEGECVRTGVPLQWRTRCTGFSLYRASIPSSVRWDDFGRVAQDSARAWSVVPCDADGRTRPYFQLLPNLPTWNPTGYNPRGQNSNTIAFRPKWNDNTIHRPGAIAITIATYDSFTGEIYDADIEMNSYHDVTNPTGFHFSAETRTAPAGMTDLQTILTHEFGHFLGLSHSESDRAAMWWMAGVAEVRRDLTADDAAGMCVIYPVSSMPATRCLPVPYGGLATHQGGTRVIAGECSTTTPGVQGRGGVLYVLLGAVLAMFGWRRRRRV